MSVKAYYSTDTDAPVLSGQAGALAALLHACLVAGYGAKTPPGGWASPSGIVANKLALHSAFAGATGIWLHMDDSGAQCALVRAWESITTIDGSGDVSVGSAMFPTLAQSPNYGWKKSNASDATARPWAVIADESACFVILDTNGAGDGTGQVCYFFGDIYKYRDSDAYHFLISGGTTIADGNVSAGHNGRLLYHSNYGETFADTRRWIARRYDQLGAAVAVAEAGDGSVLTSPGTYFGQGGDANVKAIPYPNPVDNGILLAPVSVFESGPYVRGQIPGMYQPLHSTPLPDRASLTDLVGVPGKTLQAFKIYGGSANLGQVLFDVTGPWR